MDRRTEEIEISPTLLFKIKLCYLHFLSLIAVKSCPNITAPLSIDIPASSKLITLFLGNL